MASLRWRKIFRDLWLHRFRSALVVAAMAVSLAGAGTILNAWALVQRATREGYLASNPRSATIRTAAVDAELVERVGKLPGIGAVEARGVVGATIRSRGAWYPAILFTAPDLGRIRIGRLDPEAGPWPPARSAFVVERSSMNFAGVALGETVEIATGEGPPRSVPVTGIVRDVGLAPGWMEHVVYGFVSQSTLEDLGAGSALDELAIVAADRTVDREQVRRLAYRVKQLVESTGRSVSGVDVPVPGQHIHAGQMDSLLLTQGAFGLLALVLSGFLVVNLLSALLVGQVREIGVMKTLGARSEQLGAMYLGFALVLGVLATAIGLPPAILIGRRYAELKGELLNFEIAGYGTPGWAIGLLVGAGCLMPVIAALGPVWRGSRLSVGDAIRDVGINLSDAATPGWLLTRLPGLPRPVLLSLRNAFRRRQRMVVTVVTLATGGAIFLGARSLRRAIQGSVDLLFSRQRFELALRLGAPAPPDSIVAAVTAVHGVTGAEAWGGARAAVHHRDGTLGNAFQVVAPPADTRLLVPEVKQGRWPEANQGLALVVSASLVRDEPSLQVGDSVNLVVGGRQARWLVAAVVDAGPSPVGYAAREALQGWLGQRGASSVMVATGLSGLASQLDLIQRLRLELADRGMPVASSQRLAETRRVIEDHLLMVVDFLAVMGWVIAVVGGMGLASTMSLAVLERTREIGVLRAIGARHRAIAAMVLVEGAVIGGLSAVVALPLSIPMSFLLGQAFGRVMMPVAPRYLPPAGGMIACLVLVLVLSVVASAWPAWRAMRVPTRTALAYQ
jgi:putative ABC transport system permease protein